MVAKTDFIFVVKGDFVLCYLGGFFFKKKMAVMVLLMLSMSSG